MKKLTSWSEAVLQRAGDTKAVTTKTFICPKAVIFWVGCGVKPPVCTPTGDLDNLVSLFLFVPYPPSRLT